MELHNYTRLNLIVKAQQKHPSLWHIPTQVISPRSGLHYGYTYCSYTIALCLLMIIITIQLFNHYLCGL